MNQTLLAWAYLSRVIEGPSKNLQELLEAGRGPEELAHGIRVRASWLGRLAEETEVRYSWARPAEDLEAAAAVGARLITPDDDEWPTTELDHAFGFARSGLSEHVRTYQSDAVRPHALWIRGRPLAPLLARAVAVVGTRTVSNYGRRATEVIVNDLTSHHWTIVSGGALGVDTMAHRTALNAGAPTLAITACGIDRIYPKQNQELFKELTVVTEYPPGSPPQRHRFLTRNRLVAALTQGTVVVEAAWRSGALNTLSWAEGLARVAMAVPGPITSQSSQGCHRRITEGRAQLVTSGADIRSLLEAAGTVDAAEQYELNFAAETITPLSRNELRIFDALPVDGARSTDDIAREAGLTIPLCVSLLVELSLRGVVVRVADRWQRVG